MHDRSGAGPIPARIMLVGEAFGEREEQAGEPFIGASGAELNRMLHEAGIMRTECYVTNLVNARPPKNEITAWIYDKKRNIPEGFVPFRDAWVAPIVKEGFERLLQEISLVSPNIIVTLGNTPMWALLGAHGVTKWRGSHLRFGPTKLIPTLHPALILRQWEARALVVSDLKRAKRESDSLEWLHEPKWYFHIRPSFAQAQEILLNLLDRLKVQGELWIEFDLETRAGHIACAGISWSHTEAICIPFMCLERADGYWTQEEESTLVLLLYKLLTHPSVRVRGQNLLYDAQYTHRHWHFIPRVAQDSMISHHVAFAGLPKSLAFQASLYSPHYVFWKDEGKTWDKNTGEEQLWRYNCVDCVRTRETGEGSAEAVRALHLGDVDAFQQRLFWPALRAMLRGIKVDKAERTAMAGKLFEEISKREAYFQAVLGHDLNPRSSLQMSSLFYEDLKLPAIIKRSTNRPTLDDEALDKLASKEPLLRPLIKSIREYRSLGVFLSTFVQAPLDFDGRMRCSFNVCGTESYRLSSSANAFGSGTNLQNLPKGSMSKDPDELSLPNVRTLFIPDTGYTFFDLDLDRADLQVVVWEADDKELKQALRLGIDLHCLNACDIFSIKGIPPEELVESHSNYGDHRKRIGEQKRQLAKMGVHATNYGCRERTLAGHLGSTVQEADRFIRSWLSAHPGIAAWHERTARSISTTRCITNKFGYRRFYFERPEGILSEALAWVPQSTVACVINRVWVSLYEQFPHIEVLLQVHDSLAGQFPTHRTSECLKQLAESSHVVIPYDDPLIIPTGVKISSTSWGSCTSVPTRR